MCNKKYYDIIMQYCVEKKKQKNKNVTMDRLRDWNKPAAVSVRAAFRGRWHKGRAIDGSTSGTRAAGG